MTLIQEKLLTVALLQVVGEKHLIFLLVFSIDLPVFLWSENNIKIFIWLLHSVLFPGKFLEVCGCRFSIHEASACLPQYVYIILPVYFEFMQLSHILVSGDQVVRI